MKETDKWLNHFLSVKHEKSKNWGNGVTDKVINGESRHGWGVCMNILSDKNKTYTHLNLDCSFPTTPSHKKVEICFLFDINLCSTLEYIASYNPYSYRRGNLSSTYKYSYDYLIYLVQRDFQIREGYNSYKVDIGNDGKSTVTLYTHYYNLTIAYDLYEEKAELCFYPKGDDEYFLSIELPIDIYGNLRDVVLNWEHDYYGKLLDLHSVS